MGSEAEGKAIDTHKARVGHQVKSPLFASLLYRVKGSGLGRVDRWFSAAEEKAHTEVS